MKYLTVIQNNRTELNTADKQHASISPNTKKQIKRRVQSKRCVCVCVCARARMYTNRNKTMLALYIFANHGYVTFACYDVAVMLKLYQL